MLEVAKAPAAGVEVLPARGSRLARASTAFLSRFGIFAVILVAWWVIAEFRVFPQSIVATPASVVRAFGNSWSTLAPQLVTTVGEIVIALAIGWGLGLALGCLLGGVRRLWPLLGLVRAAYAFPLIVIFPILTVWFGYGSLGKIFFGALACVVPMTLMTASAVMTVDRTIIVLFRSMGASRLQLAYKGIIPASMAGVIGALRLSGSFGLVSVVVGEMLISTHGLGSWIANSAELFETPNVYLGICIVVVMAAILQGVIVLIEVATARWARSR
jgi:ABC-type nitrate/sulfonate/bicarbonate transport system permease component